MVIPSQAGPDLEEIPGLPATEWRDRAVNDFEKPVFSEHPELASLKEELYASGAVYASMSGSGSALYGIFPARPVLSPPLENYPSYAAWMT